MLVLNSQCQCHKLQDRQQEDHAADSRMAVEDPSIPWQWHPLANTATNHFNHPKQNVLSTMSFFESAENRRQSFSINGRNCLSNRRSETYDSIWFNNFSLHLSQISISTIHPDSVNLHLFYSFSNFADKSDTTNKISSFWMSGDVYFALH